MVSRVPADDDKENRWTYAFSYLCPGLYFRVFQTETERTVIASFLLNGNLYNSLVHGLKINKKSRKSMVKRE